MKTTRLNRVTATDRRAGATALLLVGLACVAVVGCRPVAEVAASDAAGTPTTTTAQTTTTRPKVQPFLIDQAYTGTAGPRVAVIGDSLTVAGRPQLFSALSEYRVKIASVVGEGIGGGPWSRGWNHDVLGNATKGYLAGPDTPDALVVALGTNNAWQTELTIEMFEAAWPQMVAGYQGSCLVVVTATESDQPVNYDSAEAAAINAALALRADRVIDWEAVQIPEHLKADHIHLRPEGLRHRAQLIKDAVDSCDLRSEQPPVSNLPG